MMNERAWVRTFVSVVEARLRMIEPTLSVHPGEKLPYANEIHAYSASDVPQSDFMRYETDILVTQRTDEGGWIPRVIVETKFRGSVSTHDAITYSHKAITHKQVHPYLRYGILIGEMGGDPLPGRLFRHGTQFDFMMVWAGRAATKQEMSSFVDVLIKEVAASRTMQEIIFDSRKKARRRYTMLHKQLTLS